MKRIWDWLSDDPVDIPIPMGTSGYVVQVMPRLVIAMLAILSFQYFACA